MTLRRRIERLEGPTTGPEDEAAMDEEIRRLLEEISARDGVPVSVLIAEAIPAVVAAEARARGVEPPPRPR